MLRALTPAVFGLVLLAAFQDSERGATKPDDPWRSDLAAATAEAAETGKPLLAVFR